VGNVYNCATDPYTNLYEIPFLFRPDRTRWAAGGFDWTAPPNPAPGAAPRNQDYTVIENAHPNPAAADLDGDGLMEILYPSYDGRVHAFRLDRTQPGAWPFEVASARDLRLASEPTVADLDNDGQAEVIFASWPRKGSNQPGKLHIVSAQGQAIHEINLPSARGADWNGGLAAPTLANIDGDPDLEVVLVTAHSGMVAYELPGTAGARLLWGTGRGSYLRSGGPPLYVPASLGFDTYLPGIRR
jgi:hypothetical protein